MKWIKQGVIFAPDHNYDWMVSHASVPVADEAGDGVLRIYFGTRDGRGRSQTSFFEVEAASPTNVLYIHNRPILPLGRPGTFDDSGIMPSWIVNHGNQKYFYYIGWNPQVTVAYRLSIGLAVSEDGGKSFEKVSEGPICDRSLNEPFFNTAPSVLFADSSWKMWYVSCTGWEIINGLPDPRYHIKYAISDDGLNWQKTGVVCVDYDNDTDAIGRPCVFRENGLYKMFYSYRSLVDYRTDRTQSYRLGYAESPDGINWTRRDDEVGIARSESGWDAEMIEYCHLYEHKGQKYLLYNGNGFGESGIGYAVLDQE